MKSNSGLSLVAETGATSGPYCFGGEGGSGQESTFYLVGAFIYFLLAIHLLEMIISVY